MRRRNANDRLTDARPAGILKCEQRKHNRNQVAVHAVRRKALYSSLRRIESLFDVCLTSYSGIIQCEWQTGSGQ